MPNLVKEITQGQTKSKEQGGDNARASGTAARVFRVVLSSPGETFDEQSVCGVSVGSAHPTESGYICVSFTTSYDGESRMVVNVTFNYQLLQDNGDNGNNQPPDIRPARWSISSAIYEKPVWSWRKRISVNNLWGAAVPAANPVGDIYDGVTAMSAIVTISISQYEPTDPTRHAEYVGHINSERIVLGSLVMQPHTVMLRGVQSTPTVENFGGQIYRGWIANYEFAYKANKTRIHFGEDGADGFVAVDLGWDIAVPQTGFNCRAFDPQNPSAIQDVYGQPLRHGDADDPQYAGRIKQPLSLPDGVEAGSRQRSMVRVFAYQNEGATQTPSALPICLNDDGTPRKLQDLDSEAGTVPLVYGYQVHEDTNFTVMLRIRL